MQPNDPHSDLRRERDVSWIAVICMATFAGLTVTRNAFTVWFAFHAHSIVTTYFSTGHPYLSDRMLDDLDGRHRLVLVSGLTWGFSILVSIGLFVWLARSATLQSRLKGKPNETAALIASFCIPVANLVWPYIELRNLSPDLKAARRALTRWYVVHLSFCLTFLVAAIVLLDQSFRDPGLAPTNAVFQSLEAVFALLWVLTFARVMRDITAAHEEQVAERFPSDLSSIFQ